ncbi:MAG TPA: hypothetical protein VNC84_00945 [Gammaproteobacteria bacterium]|jgi:hypothetical protein|nr:hypothetical protein [Gammaproteobacteria bacterium]
MACSRLFGETNTLKTETNEIEAQIRRQARKAAEIFRRQPDFTEEELIASALDPDLQKLRDTAFVLREKPELLVNFLRETLPTAEHNGTLEEMLSKKVMVKVQGIQQWLYVTLLGLGLGSGLGRQWVHSYLYILIRVYRQLESTGREGIALFQRHFDEHFQYRDAMLPYTNETIGCINRIVAHLDQLTLSGIDGITLENPKLAALNEELKEFLNPYLFFSGFWREHIDVISTAVLKIYATQLSKLKAKEKNHWSKETLTLFFDMTAFFARGETTIHACMADYSASDDALCELKNRKFQMDTLALRDTAFRDRNQLITTSEIPSSYDYEIDFCSDLRALGISKGFNRF